MSCLRRIVAGPLPADARGRSHVSPRDIYGARSGTRTEFSRSALVFSLSISFHQCSVLFFIYILLLPEGQSREPWELKNKQRSSGHLKALDRIVLSFFYSNFRGVISIWALLLIKNAKRKKPEMMGNYLMTHVLAVSCCSEREVAGEVCLDYSRRG